MSRIHDPVGVFLSDRAIRSESARHGVMWFFATFERGRPTFLALPEDDDEPHEVDRAVVERNVDHDHTECESVPVDDSPFDVE